jgi:eukaryotic-like serine/threonine-protein kinase
MGEVYRARDTRLDRDVALKILPPSFAGDPDRLLRLEQEARAAGQINHPNVATVYDVTTVNGAPGIVSELLEGETLGERLARGRIPAAQAIRYGVHIAEGLAAAHRRGVIHRDLKPDNIFVSSDGDLAKILDFGLARAIEPAVSDAPTAPRLTLPGTVMGTVGYMSPEQVRGVTADQRSDIFSFGVVLFEMLSGRRAFQRGSAADTMSAILTEEPPELPGEQAGLLAILRRCLAKNPDARYQSARDLAFHLEQLSSFSGPAPVEARARARKWPYVAAAAAVIAALLATGLMWQRLDRPAPAAAVARTNSIAVVPFANIGGTPETEYFSDGMTEELITALSRVDGLRVVARTSSFAFKGKQGDAREIAKQLGVEHLLEGSVRQSGNRLRVTAQLIEGSNGYNVWSETYDRELRDVLLIQDEISREIAGRLVSKPAAPPRAQRPSAEEFAAYDLYLQGNFVSNQALLAGSEPLLERAVDLYEQAIARNPRFAAAYAGLANAYTHFEAVGGANLAERHRKGAVAARKALELDPNLAEAHVALGDVLFHHENDVAGGEREFRRAIELDPNLAQAHTYYAYLLLREYRLEEAIARGRVALQLSPFDSYAATVLGQALTFSRRYEEAIAVLEPAVKRDPLSFALPELAVAHSMHGEHEKAVAEWGRWAATTKPQPFGRMVHAWVLARAGRRNEATKILNEVLAYPPEERIKASHSFGGTYIALGDNERALAWLKKGVDAGVVNWFEVKAAPWFDALRSDPRFTALIEEAAVEEKRK